MIHLASNENPLGMSPAARAAAVDAMAASSDYPDGNSQALRHGLASRLGVPADWVVMGSGSCEILTLTAQACVQPGQSVVWSQYGFLVYGQATALAHGRGVVVPAVDFGHDLDRMAQAIDDRTALVFVANPNNPTGTLISPERLHAFVKQVPPQVVILLDEAYGEYLDAEQRWDSVAWVRAHPNLIVARTFSKAFGLAGMRVGYGMANPALLARLNAVRPRFNITTPAQAAALAALGDEDFAQQTFVTNKQGRAQLAQGLEALGLRYLPSAGNFLMIECPGAKAAHAALLGRGIAVATLEPYALPDWLRITVGLPDQNRAVLDALGHFLQATVAHASA